MKTDRKMNRKALPALVGILLACLASTAYATALTLSGAHLPIPDPNPGRPAHQVRAIISQNSVGWTGQWTAPALAAWRGKFHATGPVPAGTANPTGTTTYDFTTDLPDKELPAGTFFTFHDVDFGSMQTETFTLNAWDSTGSLITTRAWLDEPIGVWGTGRGGSGDPTLLDMPGWDYSAGEYFIDGRTVTGFNPTVNFMLESNEAITKLTVVRNSNFGHFWLAAPVPEPSTGLLALLAVGGLAVMRRRR